jgi:hypothetical protein
MRSCGLLSVFSIHDSKSLCDCLLDRTLFGASHLEDLTQKAALAQRTGKRSKIRFGNNMLEQINPVAINETVTNHAWIWGLPITYYDYAAEVGFSGLQNRKTPRV